MAASCQTCGGPMPTNKGKGRPRVHCAECRPTRRMKPPVAPLPAPLDNVPQGGAQSVYGAVLGELTAAGRQDTAKGRAALLLASRLDEKVDTAAGMAAAVKQLREALDDVLAGATVAADPVDELQRRRAAKFA